MTPRVITQLLWLWITIVIWSYIPSSIDCERVISVPLSLKWWFPIASDIDDYIIMTTHGRVRGRRLMDSDQSNGVDLYANIPYAAPPVGHRRFQSPVPPEPWNDVRSWNVTDPLPICPQFKLVDRTFLGNEDCLYLDVYVPSQWKHGDPLLPVMFWIYGGIYVIGDKYEFSWYDGANLVANTGHNMIVVSANYRLGSLGFLALSQLRDEDANGSTGNYGLQDQQMAMKWVQANIERFGGDPKRVTIFGESAGAFSVCSHLAMPSSRGLFHGAISQSGSCEWALPLPSAITLSEQYSSRMGCDVANEEHPIVECLRNKTTNQLLGAPFITDLPEPLTVAQRYLTGFLPGQSSSMMITPSFPTIDNSSAGLIASPLHVLQSGRFNNVPLIMGTNKDEFKIFWTAIGFVPELRDAGVRIPLEFDELNKTLTWLYDAKILDTIYTAYPMDEYRNADDLFVAATTDRTFLCPTRRALTAVTKHGNRGVYQYHMHYRGDTIDKPLGVYHMYDLNFVWGNLLGEDSPMTTMFQTYWANFATSHTPNEPRAVNTSWPSWSPSTREALVLDIPPSIDRDIRRRQCDYWDTIDR